MTRRLVCLEFELCLCDGSVSVAVLIGEHVVDDAVGVEAGSQAAFTLIYLLHDVVCKLRREEKRVNRGIINLKKKDDDSR